MRRESILALALASALSLQAIGQNPTSPRVATPRKQDAPAPDEVVRITSNLVQVDVAVTDKKGRPVPDLRPEEFEILEDGRPQQITHFSYVSVAPGPPPAVSPPLGPADNAAARAGEAPAPAPAPPVRLRPDEVRRTIALVVDDLGLSFESMYFVRRALKKFVDEQMQPGDLAAIIRTGGGVGALQQFTADKRLLHAAAERVRWNSRGRSGVAAFAPIEDNPIDTFNKRPRPGGGELAPAPSNILTRSNIEQGARAGHGDFREEIFSVGTLGALNYIVRGLRGMPGRKSVVLMSDNMALFDSQGGENFRTVQALRRLTDLANRASVVIYTIDARGLPPLNLTAADNTSGLTTLPNGAIARANSGPALAHALNQRSLDYFNSQDGLNYLALQTGGFFVYNNNDINSGIERVLDDQKGFYLIGYRPDDSTFDAATGRRKFHDIEVKVRRPGLNVRTRTGFFGITNEEARPERRTTEEELVAALTSPFASGEVDMRLTPVFLNDPDQGSFMRSFIYVGGRGLTFTEQPDGFHQASVEVLAMTFGDDGIPVDRRFRSETVRVRRDEYQATLERGLIFGINLPVKRPGAFQLRVAVRDAGSGRTGSANQLIEVPNLGKGRLVLSGIYLAGAEASANVRARADANAPIEGGAQGDTNEGMVGEADPQAGPAVRRFRPGALISYGYEVYNARLDKTTRRPRLQSQVRLFCENRLVFAGKVVSLNGQANSQRLTAFGRLQLGSNLAPGEYVLQVVVTDALAKEKHRLATQWMEFEIR